MSTVTDTAVKLEKARKLYEAAQEAERVEQERRTAEAAADLRRRDEAFQADYDDTRLAEDVTAAEQELRAALAADPVFRAMAKVYALQLRRAHQSLEAAAVASRLGTAAPVSRSAYEPTFEGLLRMVAGLGEDMHNAMPPAA